MLIDFRQWEREGEKKRGRERSREGEKHRSISSPTHPNWGLNLEPRHVPWQGMEPMTFRFTGWLSNQVRHPVRVTFTFKWQPFLPSTFGFEWRWQASTVVWEGSEEYPWSSRQGPPCKGCGLFDLKVCFSCGVIWKPPLSLLLSPLHWARSHSVSNVLSSWSSWHGGACFLQLLN